MNAASLFSLAGIILSAAGGLLINTVQKSIGKLLGIFIFYVGGSLLMLNVCSFQMCAALLVCGIGVSVMLGTGHPEQYEDVINRDSFRQIALFRIFLSVIFGILAYTITDQIRLWIPVRRTILLISVWIGSLSLISLAMDDNLHFRCVYIQGLCLSFTLLYNYMENSVLIFASFMAINLLMAFVSAVLTSGRSPVPSDRIEEQQ